jgi:hypothetical protein
MRSQVSPRIRVTCMLQLCIFCLAAARHRVALFKLEAVMRLYLTFRSSFRKDTLNILEGLEQIERARLNCVYRCMRRRDSRSCVSLRTSLLYLTIIPLPLASASSHPLPLSPLPVR